MHKVLHTHELLDEIFSYFSKQTNAISARVCRLWFAHAVPLIWDTVKLNDALKVLSPSVIKDISMQQPLLPHSWDRFFLYSKHVRVLICSSIKYTTLRQAAVWRPSGDLFPSKLTIIHWDGKEKHVEYLIPLLTSTLRVLVIALGDIRKSDMIDALCKTISTRSPLLHVFTVDLKPADGYIKVIPRSLAELLSLLTRLVSFTIPIYFMTTELFIILSQLRMLGDLSLLQPNYFPGVDTNKFSKGKIPEKEDEHLYFCSLERMEVFDDEEMQVFDDGEIDQTFTMAKAFRLGIRLPRLVDLTCSPRSEHIIDLMESLHVICPNLEKISIYAEYTFPWVGICSLLKCRALIELKSEAIIDMGLDNLATIATDRPTWKIIRLQSVNDFSYQALVILAQNCPYLTGLAISLSNESGIPDLGTVSPDVMFPSLTMLDVHISSITGKSQIEVATFLSRICAQPIDIECSSGQDIPVWDAVEGMVNSTITARLENLALREEIAELQSKRMDCISCSNAA